MDSKAEFEFIDFTKPSIKSDVPETSFEDHRSKLRAMRPIAYGLLAFWFGLYAAIAYFAGWFDRWFQ